ncbi:hypothetical protein [Natrinema sp. 74]
MPVATASTVAEHVTDRSSRSADPTASAVAVLPTAVETATRAPNDR